MQEFFKKHDLLNKFIALFVAITLWSIVMNIKNPIITKSYNDILVDFTSLSLIEDTYDLIIISDEFPTVDVKLKGSRDDFIQITAANIAVTADLSHIKEPGEYQIHYNVKLPYSDMEVTSKYPEKLTVIIDVLEIKQIPVEVELKGSPADSYSFDEIDVQSTINISGPSNELAKVTNAYTSIDVSDASTSISGVYDIILQDQYDSQIISENITQSDKSLEINLPILQTISVPLAVDLVYGDIVSDKRIEGYTIQTPYVSLIGEPQYVANIRSIYLGEIAVDDTQYGKSEFIFALPYMENASYVSGTSNSVTVNINFTDYTTQYFNVSNFIYDAEMFDNMNILNNYVRVAISGNQSDLETLVSNDITLELIIELETIEVTDEEGNITEEYVPLDPGTYEFDAILNIDSSLTFDFTDEYVITVQVLEPVVEE